MRQSFPRLHVASAYSPHYGVTMPEVLVDQAAAAGADFLALTDRDGLWGGEARAGMRGSRNPGGPRRGTGRPR